MSCMIRAVGVSFDVDSFLASSNLKPHHKFHRGHRRSANLTYDYSGVNVVASDAEFWELHQQIEDAIVFLEQNRIELQRLSGNAGVEQVTIDFGIAIRNVAVQSEQFPPRLLSLVGDLGITLAFTLYPSGDNV